MKARSVPLGVGRRFIADLSATALGVPLGVMTRAINLSGLQAARAASTVKAPWTVLLARGFGLVAAEQPVLRRAYVKLPWPRLAEVDHSTGMIMVEREWAGETVVLPVRIKFPGERPLTDLIDDLKQALATPVEQTRALRTLLIVNRLPWSLRRILWWFAFNGGLTRAIHFGTFGISTLGQFGVSIVRPISPLTIFLSLGPIAADGTAEITVGFDHRVMDGAVVARGLIALEDTLNSRVAREVAALVAPA